MESPWAGRAQDRAGGSTGEERLRHWETAAGMLAPGEFDGGLMLRISGGQ